MYSLFCDNELIGVDMTMEEIDRFFETMPEWAKAEHAKRRTVFEIVGDNICEHARIFGTVGNFEVISEGC